MNVSMSELLTPSEGGTLLPFGESLRPAEGGRHVSGRPSRRNRTSKRTIYLAELDHQVLLTEIERRGIGLAAVGKNGLEMPFAVAVVRRLVPDQLHGRPRFDAGADVKYAILLAVRRRQQLNYF